MKCPKCRGWLEYEMLYVNGDKVDGFRCITCGERLDWDGNIIARKVGYGEKFEVLARQIDTNEEDESAGPDDEAEEKEPENPVSAPKGGDGEVIEGRKQKAEGREKIPCAVCMTPFVPQRSDSKICANHACAVSFYQRRRDEKRKPPKKDLTKTKICRKCGKEKPWTEEYFARCGKELRWWEGRCLECRKADDRRQKAKNRVPGKRDYKGEYIDRIRRKAEKEMENYGLQKTPVVNPPKWVDIDAASIVLGQSVIDGLRKSMIKDPIVRKAIIEEYQTFLKESAGRFA